MFKDPHKAQNFWNFIFSLFFLAVLCAAANYMKEVRGGYLVSVPPFDALLMALATFRITRLVVYDKITRWFRDLFLGSNSFASTIRDLLGCPWCIGIWASLIVVFCYFIFSWAWFVIFFWRLPEQALCSRYSPMPSVGRPSSSKTTLPVSLFKSDRYPQNRVAGVLLYDYHSDSAVAGAVK